MNAERQAVAGGVDLGDKAGQLAAFEAMHMQDRPEYLAFQLADRADFNKRWRDEGAGGALGGKRRLKQNARLVRGEIGCEPGLGLGIDDRPNIGFELRGSANAQLPHRALEHADDAVRDGVLQAEDAKRRAALARGVEGGGQHVANHLLRQRRGVHDHRVLAAGLRDEGNVAAPGDRALYVACDPG